MMQEEDEENILFDQADFEDEINDDKTTLLNNQVGNPIIRLRIMCLIQVCFYFLYRS